MADQGVCSRRKAEVFISEGKIRVNGKVISEMGVKINPEKDKVELNGERVGMSKDQKIYIALNKPIDYICSASSEQGQSVLDLLVQENYWKNDKVGVGTRVYPVGRLDKDSEGLVLLTNDGGLTQELTHPKYEHEKEYELLIDSRLSKDAKKVLESGMDIGADTVKGIRIIKEGQVGRKVILEVVLEEGKNRQIKRMFGRLGYDLFSLKRTRIGKLKLGTLPVGRWRFVRRDQII
ncbi:rRNA pseudouridine synthase [Candidatus Parcubacteria bacterium]|nr:rRNA pseudouridine synthase [Candidatus Parcubacteria bacterium]